MFDTLNDRSREILRHIVEEYVETGTPLGSRTLARRLEEGVSPATIRNAMSDLEEAGLLYSPHTSAGRLPTDLGLRLFVDGLLQVGNMTEDERAAIQAQCEANGRSITQVLEEASGLMSGLSRCAGLVSAPVKTATLRHIEFVSLGPGRALVVMVDENGLVENRVVDVPVDLSPSALVEASNFLSAKILGRTLEEVRAQVETEISANQTEIDTLTQRVVEAGLATWAEAQDGKGVLIVSGQSNLLNDVGGISDLDQIRALFAALEKKESMLRLLDASKSAGGVQIFIGADNDLFSLSGCAMIVAPYQNKDEKVVGAIGVVGPSRMNYARIVPMVDYTAKVVGRIIG